MPACLSCGKELKADAVFCTVCGAPVTSYSRRRTRETPAATIVNAPPPRAQPPPPRSMPATVAYFFGVLTVVCAALYGVSVLYTGYSIRKASTSGSHSYSSGRYIECAKHFRYLTRKVPKNEDYWAMQGECLALAGNNADAVHVLKSALKWHPDSSRMLTLLGTALFNQGKYADAAGHFQKAIKADPMNSRPHFHLGLTYEKLGKIQPAIEHLEKALPLMDSEKIKVLEPLGHLYFSSKKYEKASEKIEEALKVDPNRFSTRLAAAETYFAMGNYRKALLNAEAANAINPESGKAKKLRDKISGSIELTDETNYLENRRVLDGRYLKLYNDVNRFITALNEKMAEMLGKKNPEIEQIEKRSVELLGDYQAIPPPGRYFTVHTICVGNVVMLQKVIQDLKYFVGTAAPNDRERFEELSASIQSLSRENEKLFDIWKAEDEKLKETKPAGESE